MSRKCTQDNKSLAMRLPARNAERKASSKSIVKVETTAATGASGAPGLNLRRALERVPCETNPEGGGSRFDVCEEVTTEFRHRDARGWAVKSPFGQNGRRGGWDREKTVPTGDMIGNAVLAANATHGEAHVLLMLPVVRFWGTGAIRHFQHLLKEVE